MSVKNGDWYESRRLRRKEDYRKRVARLKVTGKYEAYLAKRRKQAYAAYHRADAEGASRRKRMEKERYLKRIARMKEEGTYQTYLEISRKRTKAWRSRKRGLEPPPPLSPPPSEPKVEPEPEPMLPLHVPMSPLNIPLWD